MPPKDLALFLYIPQNNPLSTIRYEVTVGILVSKRVKIQKTEKTGAPMNPTTTPPQKFMLLLRYNLFMGVNKIRVKKYCRDCVG